MLQLKKLMLGLLLAALSVNPVYASAIASMNETGVEQAAHRTDSRTAARQHVHCHSQSSEHLKQAPSCCKTGQCDCSQACAVLPSIVSTSISISAVTVVPRFSLGLPPLAPVRFFRPPIV